MKKVLDRLNMLCLEVLTLEQSCNDCKHGQHPQIPFGLQGILNTLSWGCEGAAVNNAMVHSALPLFGYLANRSDADFEISELTIHHPNVAELMKLLGSFDPTRT